MKKIFLLSAMLLTAAATARADFNFSISFGSPFPVVVPRPVPVVNYTPPVVVTRPAVVCAPAPVCVPAPVVVVAPPRCAAPVFVGSYFGNHHHGRVAHYTSRGRHFDRH